MLFPGDASPRGRHAGAYDPSTSVGRKFLKLVIALIVLLILSWPFIEPFMLETESVTLTAEDLPAGVGQLRIVYATDIHKGGMFTDGRVTDLISHINACNADIVLWAAITPRTAPARSIFSTACPASMPGTACMPSWATMTAPSRKAT